MTTEDTPKPVAWMINNLLVPRQKPWPTRVDSDAYQLAAGRREYEVTPLFDKATIDAAVAAERERCIAAVFAWAHDAIDRKACATFSAPTAAEQIVKRL